MGRKEQGYLTIHIEPSEKEIIDAMADAVHMTTKDYVRACCLHKKVMDTSWMPEITKQIIGIAGNINQITMIANKHHSVSQAQVDILNQNLISVKTELRKIANNLMPPPDKEIITCKELLQKISDILDERLME